MAKSYYINGMTYAPGKLQEQISWFLIRGEKEKEIPIPEDRTLASVRGSYDRSIKSMRVRVGMTQRNGKLFMYKF